MATCTASASSAYLRLALSLTLTTSVPALAQSLNAGARGDVVERLRQAREGAAPSQAPAGPSSLPTPSEAQKKRAFEGLRRRAPAPAIEARARNALAKARDAMAGERDAMARRIGEAVGLDAPEALVAGAAPAPHAPKTWVAVLFVSSSMPVSTLRTYALQLERTKGVMAFRGMPGGLTKVAPMARLTARILRIDPGCEGPACAMRDVQVIVDPLLFRQHGVARVPALTLLPGDPTQPYCEREAGSPRGSHLVVGDAALSGLFEEYGRLGGKEEVRDASALVESR
jgi:hypothetical protein